MRNLLAILSFIALIAVTLTVIPQRFISQWFDNSKQTSQTVAQMTPQSGVIFYKSQVVESTVDMAYDSLFSMNSGSQVEVRLLDSEFEFQLQSAQGKFKSYKDKTLLILSAGDYTPISDPVDDFYIIKNSKVYASNIKLKKPTPQYRPVIEDAITQAPLIVSDEFDDLPKAVEKIKSTTKKQPEVLEAEPDNAFLDSLIAEQTEKLQNCQVNRIRELGTVKGQVMIGLEIHPTGAIKNAKILSTDIDDTELMNCLLSVFERIKLPKYKGEVIYRSYPLLFE